MLPLSVIRWIFPPVVTLLELQKEIENKIIQTRETKDEGSQKSVIMHLLQMNVMFDVSAAAQTLIVDVQNDANVSAVLDVVHKTAMIVFWGPGGGTTTIPPLLGGYASISVSTNTGLLVILEMETWNVTIADPTQSASNAEVTFQLDSGRPPVGWSGEDVVTVPFTLPTLGLAGSSVSIPLFDP